MHLRPFEAQAPVDAWVDVLVSTGQVRRMVAPDPRQVDGRPGVRILHITNFLRHQVINRATLPRFGWPDVLQELSAAERGKSMKQAAKRMAPWSSYVPFPVPTRRQREAVRRKFSVKIGEPVDVKCELCARPGTLFYIPALHGQHSMWDGATVASVVEIVPDPHDDAEARILCRLCRQDEYGLPECPAPGVPVAADVEPQRLALDEGSEVTGDDEEDDWGGEEEPAEPVVSITAAKRPVRERPRTLVFDAVAEVCHIDVAKLTTTARGPLNRAVADLKKVGATPEEVVLRARTYRRLYSHAALTPMALSKHWAACGEDAVKERGPSANVSSFEGVSTGRVRRGVGHG
jgi:hypothetical protein